MQLYETSCIQNIVKIQMNISVYFPRDFLSPSLGEVCSLFTALMYRTPTLLLFNNTQCYNQAEADFVSLRQVLHESEA